MCLHAQLSQAVVISSVRQFKVWVGSLFLVSLCKNSIITLFIIAESRSASIAVCYWTFFRLTYYMSQTKHATNKLASSRQVPCRMVKTLHHCAIHMYSMCYSFLYPLPVFFWTFPLNLCCSSSGSKTAAGSIDYAQNT